MDSASMFDGLSIGADTAITGMVTLVAIADMLNQVKSDIRNQDIENVFLVFFNGEAFDYIGSSRMAYDMKLGMPLSQNLCVQQLTFVCFRTFPKTFEGGESFTKSANWP